MPTPGFAVSFIILHSFIVLLPFPYELNQNCQLAHIDGY
jgi:hypothetical protein